MKTKIININKIFTWNPEKDSLDILKNKQILIENNSILKIEDNISDDCKIIDANYCSLTPGFIDSHTHPIFIGDRSIEFYNRAKGLSYEDIKNSGGGILNSIKKVQNSSFDELFESSINNIKPFINHGTTTLEAKSGYGLSVEDEIKKIGGIDIMILGIGMNGHIGFNEPGSNQNTVTRKVRISDNSKEILSNDFNKSFIWILNVFR